MALILSQMNPVQTLSSNFFKIRFNNILPSMASLPSGLSLQIFLPYVSLKFSSFPCLVLDSSIAVYWFNNCNNIWQAMQSMTIFPTSCYLFPVNIFSSATYPRTPSVYKICLLSTILCFKQTKYLVLCRQPILENVFEY